MVLQSEIVNQVAEMLKARGETIAIAESTTGGLISSRLLSVPGASAYFLGGTVIYTRASRKVFLGASADELRGVKPMTEEMAQFFAKRVERCSRLPGALPNLESLALRGLLMELMLGTV